MGVGKDANARIEVKAGEDERKVRFGGPDGAEDRKQMPARDRGERPSNGLGGSAGSEGRGEVTSRLGEVWRIKVKAATARPHWVLACNACLLYSPLHSGPV